MRRQSYLVMGLGGVLLGSGRKAVYFGLKVSLLMGLRGQRAWTCGGLGLSSVFGKEVDDRYLKWKAEQS